MVKMRKVRNSKKYFYLNVEQLDEVIESIYKLLDGLISTSFIVCEANKNDYIRKNNKESMLASLDIILKSNENILVELQEIWKDTDYLEILRRLLVGYVERFICIHKEYAKINIFKSKYSIVYGEKEKTS